MAYSENYGMLGLAMLLAFAIFFGIPILLAIYAVKAWLEDRRKTKEEIERQKRERA